MSEGPRVEVATAAIETARKRARLGRSLYAASALLGALGLAVELAWHRTHYLALRPFVAFFSLSFEHNLPTWYASSLLLACSLALAATAERTAADARPTRRHWQTLAVVFAYLSLDEAVELHEFLERLFRSRGVLHFGWVVPAAALVLLFVLLNARFLRALPRGTRWRFVAAGAAYVGGALGMELPLGWWTARHGDENLGYALIDWVEELLEMLGATYFLLAVLRHRDELPAQERA